MAGLGDNLSLYYARNGYDVILRDEDGSATFMYYLYMNRVGDMFLMRIETISATVHEHKFFKLPLNSVVATVWAARAGYAYDYIYPVFKDMQ